MWGRTANKVIDDDYDYRNGSFFLIGIPSGPIQIREIFPFLQSEKVFRGSILGGRYIVELMLDFASRHNIKAAIEEYPMVITTNYILS